MDRNQSTLHELFQKLFVTPLVILISIPNMDGGFYRTNYQLLSL